MNRMKRNALTAGAVLVGMLAIAPQVGAADDKVIGDPYPLDTCVVAGTKLGSKGGPVVYVHNGRELKFCCAGCAGEFRAEPEKYLKTVDAKIIKSQAKHYPLETCLVMDDEPLAGEDGTEAPTEIVYNNRLVRLCCAACKRGFKKDPAAYIKRLDAAVVAKQLNDYPLTKCPIGGELGSMGEPVNMVVNNRLVRLCCAGCEKGVRKDPLAVFAKLDAATKTREGMRSATPEEVSFGGVNTIVPGEWKQLDPTSGMQLARFAVSGNDGPAECIVYYFGEDGAGDVDANIERWKGQFPGSAEPKVRTFAINGMDVTYLELHGDYQGMGATEPTPGQMACRAIVEGPKGPLYLNLTGDQAAVEANLDGYHTMLRSMKATR